MKGQREISTGPFNSRPLILFPMWEVEPMEPSSDKREIRQHYNDDKLEGKETLIWSQKPPPNIQETAVREVPFSDLSWANFCAAFR